MMKKILTFFVLLLTLSAVMAVDLANYPEMFLVDVSGKLYLNALIVVGNNAAASDVIGAIDIATSLNYYTKSTSQMQKSIEAVLASEVRGKELEKNLILIGGPCINSATAAVLGFPKDCAEGFVNGKGKIELYENNGYIALVIAGYSGEDTRLASKVLAEKMYDLTGSKIEVAGSTMKDITITPQ